jgi:hypothetical protein
VLIRGKPGEIPLGTMTSRNPDRFQKNFVQFAVPSQVDALVDQYFGYVWQILPGVWGFLFKSILCIFCPFRSCFIDF